MAGKFPVYERQVGASALNAPSPIMANASVAPGIEALGRGITQGAAGVSQMLAYQDARAERERAQSNDLRAKTVLVQAGDIQRQWLEGKDGILNKTGQNAITESEGIGTFYREQLKELTKDLTAEQRAILEPRLAQELLQFNTIVDRHVADQSKKLDKVTTDALLTGKANDAVGSGTRGDMENFLAFEAAGLGELEQLSKRSGDSAPIAEARAFEYKSSTRMALIESVMATDPDRAVGLFSSFEKDLDPDKVKGSKLRERIEGLAIKSSASTIAGNAWNKYGTDVGAAVAEIQADDSLDPRVKTTAIEAVQNRYDDHTKMIRVSDVKQLGIISQSVSRRQGAYTINDLENDPEFKKIVGEREKADAYNIVEAQKRARSKNPNTRRDQNERNEALKTAYLRMTLEHPREALDVDTDSWASNTDDQTRNEIAIIKEKHRANVDKGLTDNAAEFMKQVDYTIPAGLEREEIERRKDAAATWYRQRMLENGGKPIPTATTEAFMQRVKTDTVTPGWFRDSRESGWKTFMREQSLVAPKAQAAPAQTSAPAPAPATPPAGLVRVRDSGGKIWLLTPDKAKVAEGRGGVILP